MLQALGISGASQANLIALSNEFASCNFFKIKPKHNKLKLSNEGVWGLPRHWMKRKVLVGTGIKDQLAHECGYAGQSEF